MFTSLLNIIQNSKHSKIKASYDALAAELETQCSTQTTTLIPDHKTKTTNFNFKLIFDYLLYLKEYQELANLTLYYLQTYTNNESVALKFLAVAGNYLPEPFYIKGQKANFLTLFDPRYNKVDFEDNAKISLHYAKELNYTNKQVIAFEPPLVEDPKVPGIKYVAMNPFLLKKLQGTGWWYLIRCINFSQIKASKYTSFSKDEKIRTRNFLLSLTPDFSVEKSWEILDDLVYERNMRTHVLGLEDCRLFNYLDSEGQEQIYLDANTRDTHPYEAPKIVWAKLAKLDWSDEVKTVGLLNLDTIFYPNIKNTEKNWIPFKYTELDDKFNFLYKTCPLTILEFEQNDLPMEGKDASIIKSSIGYITQPIDLTIKEIVKISTPLDQNHYRIRNSALLTNFDDGFLTLVHEVVFTNGNERTYLHRFIWNKWSSDVNHTKCSQNFYFIHKGIEFANSMSFDESKENVYITIGYEDAVGYIITIPIATIRSMLTSNDWVTRRD